MKSLSKLFRFGPGPSSSHTIAPAIAVRSFRKLLSGKDVDEVVATLYGSLALTGKGHHSDRSIIDNFKPLPCEVVYDTKTKVSHPLTMSFEAKRNGQRILRRTYSSLGGGEITSPDDLAANEIDVYPFLSFEEIKKWMAEKGTVSFKELCLEFEKEDIDAYLLEAVQKMFASVEKGLLADSFIPANSNPSLVWKRCAHKINKAAMGIVDPEARRSMLLTSYAYAVSESSASGEAVVTAPTCGSSGVLPAILYYKHEIEGVSVDEIKNSLYVAGIFGNIVKQNASIAGAIGGCQAEIGTAASMAAAALCYLEGLSIFEQEYAAECAMEHFLGLSCDPVDGYVIIPCIERNGMGALRAYDSFLFAKYICPIRKNSVSFDNVVSAMKLTGDALASAYKETAKGGLAKILAEYQRD